MTTEHFEYSKPFSDSLWIDVVCCEVVMPGVTGKVLLHAGPPLQGAAPAAIRHAAVQALVFERWARNDKEALELLASGEIALRPAQDFDIVTPLAQVVSPSMPLAVVSTGSELGYAPLVESGAPGLRFGSSDANTQGRLRSVTEMGLYQFAAKLRERPVPLGPIIAKALATGDDCHGRTGAANRELMTEMPWINEISRAVIGGNPAFVLPILMAAAKSLLLGAGSEVRSVGSNGQHFGLRLRQESQWRTVPAAPPIGVRFDERHALRALAAIGDSAVLDFCGLGGQALACAPILQADWQRWLPGDVLQRRAAVVNPETGLVDLRRIAASKTTPLINLAILDHSGDYGLIGRGFYEPDAEQFLAEFCTD